MIILIDANRYSDAECGAPGVADVLRSSEKIIVPFVVLAELRYGFLKGTKLAENERELQRFLSTPRVEVFYPDNRTTHEYARLVLQLRQQGTPIPINDVWIAALAIQHNFTLYARDGHFDHLPQLSRI